MTPMAMRIARRHVNDFTDESEVMRNHLETMDCMDCESFLQLGIDAFHWLERADQSFRSTVLHEKAEHDPEIEEAIEWLFRSWLKSCTSAHAWIQIQQKRKYTLDNLEEFLQCEKEVRSIIRFLSEDAMTDPMRRMRDGAIAEHVNGQTAEFI